MCGSRKFYQRGSNFDKFYFFKFDEGRKDPNTFSAGHQRPASETPFKWRFAGGSMIAHH